MQMLRRPFSVSDLVSDEHVVEVIARRMLTALDEDRDRTSLSTTVERGESHVAALLNASTSGELDLPLCGYGKVRPGTSDRVRDTVETAAESAMAALSESFEMMSPGQQPNRRWLEWLWETLESYVSAEHRSSP